MQKLKNNEARPKFTGSCKKRVYSHNSNFKQLFINLTFKTFEYVLKNIFEKSFSHKVGVLIRKECISIHENEDTNNSNIHIYKSMKKLSQMRVSIFNR